VLATHKEKNVVGDVILAAAIGLKPRQLRAVMIFFDHVTQLLIETVVVERHKAGFSFRVGFAHRLFVTAKSHETGFSFPTKRATIDVVAAERPKAGLAGVWAIIRATPMTPLRVRV
jgi:hypothetical protein